MLFRSTLSLSHSLSFSLSRGLVLSILLISYHLLLIFSHLLLIFYHLLLIFYHSASLPHLHPQAIHLPSFFLHLNSKTHRGEEIDAPKNKTKTPTRSHIHPSSLSLVLVRARALSLLFVLSFALSPFCSRFRSLLLTLCLHSSIIRVQRVWSMGWLRLVGSFKS